jgi:hypothetical protein
MNVWLFDESELKKALSEYIAHICERAGATHFPGALHLGTQIDHFLRHPAAAGLRIDVAPVPEVQVDVVKRG